MIFVSRRLDHLDDMVALQHMIIHDEAMSLLDGTQPERQNGVSNFVPELIGQGNSHIMNMNLTSKESKRVNGES